MMAVGAAPRLLVALACRIVCGAASWWWRRWARVASGAEERRIGLRGCWWCWWPALRLVLLRGCR